MTSDIWLQQLSRSRAPHAQVLSLMLEQTGLHLAAFPEAPFRLANWTMRGHHCILDKTPDRMLDIQVRSPAAQNHFTHQQTALQHESPVFRLVSSVI